MDDLLVQLAKVLHDSKKSEGSAFLTALLTEEEQIMLAKRIAVVSMLHSKLSAYRIIQVLKMSSSTVMRMKRDFELGRYEPIVRVFGSSKMTQEKILKILELILGAGLPPRGKGRWKWLKKLENTPVR